MKDPLDEARRWLTRAQDEYQDAEELRERGVLFGPLHLPLPGKSLRP